MKKAIIIFAIALPAAALSQKTTLHGSYQESPYREAIEKPVSQAWDAVISFFAQNGISVTSLDREGGVIVSTGFSFLNNNSRNERKGKVEPGALFTYEENGKPNNPEAWVVLNKLVKGKIYPVKLTGNINVYIKDNEILVSLTNLIGESSNDRDKWRFFEVKSTGVLEKRIIQTVK